MTLKSIRRGKVHQLSSGTLPPVCFLEVMAHLKQGWDFSPCVGNLSPIGAWQRSVGKAVLPGLHVGEAVVLAHRQGISQGEISK